MLPDAFLAMDGLTETFLTILHQFDWFDAVIYRENAHYFPFLATTTLLMQAVGKGAGREEAHEAIKEHAVATVLDLRKGVTTENDLARRLAEDGRLGLSLSDIEDVFSHAEALTGAAQDQVDQFVARVAQWKKTYPDAFSYTPGTIL
jgi:adenylosuccinate lyase